MTLVLITGPSSEPISVEAMRGFLRISHEEENTLLENLITAARQFVEAFCRRCLMTQIWRLYCDTWPKNGVVTFPLLPLHAVQSLVVYDAQGLPSTLHEGDDFILLTQKMTNQLRILKGRGGFTSERGPEITCAVGYGSSAEDVPAPLLLAIRMLVAHWYENRAGERGDSVMGTTQPAGLTALLFPFRVPLL